MPQIDPQSQGQQLCGLDIGNALGGVRTTLLDVPIATLTSEPNTGLPFCHVFGKTIPFDQDTLRSLYRNHGKYLSKFVKSTNEAVKAGFTLKADAKALKVEAGEQRDTHFRINIPSAQGVILSILKQPSLTNDLVLEVV